MGKRFKINIPNIPAVYNDELGAEQRAWLKKQHPADYAYFVKQEKEFEAANAEKEAPAKAEEKPADKGEGGKK